MEAEVIARAVKEGRNVLPEYESKLVLKQYSIPVVEEVIVKDHGGLMNAVQRLGYPLVIKGCSPDVTHKTEEGLVFLNIRDKDQATKAFDEVYEKIGGLKDGAVLVQKMVYGKREFSVGMIRDPQFGPSVMFGLGGIFTEILKDVSFRVAPLDKDDAMEMMMEISANRIYGSVRGMPSVDMEKLAEIIVNVGKIGIENQDIMEMDINPIIILGSDPVAVDALILLRGSDPKRKKIPKGV